AYIAPLVMTGQPVELTDKTKAVPVSQITQDAGLNLHWSADSKKIHWTLGDEYFTNEVAKRFTFMEDSADSIPPITTEGTKIGLKIKTDVPQGSIAFTNARIITMNGDQVIQNGSIVVKENKIVALGEASR